MTADQRDGRVLIASNRGPVSFARGSDGTLVARRGGGGLVSGLSSVAGQADVLWVCAALSDADRAAARAAPDGRIDTGPAAGLLGAGPDGDGHRSAVRMLDIPPATFMRAYNSVANSTLWFVHHMLYDTPSQPSFGLAFRREWESFRSYNAAFATALAKGATDGDCGGQDPGGPVRAMVQDYHLPLVPRMLAEQCPDVRIAHFSHTPWAPPDYYRLLPGGVGREVLTGCWAPTTPGSCASAGRTRSSPAAPSSSALRWTTAGRLVTHRGHVTTVGVHPLGVDAAELRDRAAEPDVQAQVAALSAVTGGCRLIVRVDRTELSKNIVRGLAAYRELLVSHPQWRGRVTHLAFAYPSRHDLPEYREYTAQVQRMAAEIVDEFATDDWNPLILRGQRRLPALAGRLPAGRRAAGQPDPGRDEPGRQGGRRSWPATAARWCCPPRPARLRNSARRRCWSTRYDITQTAEALHEALIMSDSERARRRAALAQAGAALPPAAWFQAQLDALTGPVIAPGSPARPSAADATPARHRWRDRISGRSPADGNEIREEW